MAPGQFRVLAVGLAKAAGEGGEELLRQRRHLVEHSGEAGVVEHVQPGVPGRHHGRRTGPTVEQRELPEVVTDCQFGDGRAVVLDRRLTIGDEVEVAPGSPSVQMTSPAATSIGFMTMAMRSSSDGSSPANNGTARMNCWTSDFDATA